MIEDREAIGRHDIGARRERMLRVRRYTIFGLLALAGGALGFTYAMVEQSPSATWFSGSIPPVLAVVFAVVTAVVMVGGSIYYRRSMDEVDLQDNIYAGAYGAVVIMVGYPAWFLLWKGGLVPEPSHTGLFGALYLSVCAVYLYRRFR